ncbi:Radical S-adenosyl methionine domain-containing protein 1, mitochondrial [Zancudomyces culisetae]|uniref:Radical S-adenosyl methionine domain-containing protein 1, mitochondrial n=1 Tax=Zancudomyces culisetae TaxID=1213189 RepID=A0A1R1PGK2_ZANCU|nr:Radical S-adenosyl methionine domain-containing protein 1, mitochondrial [Zancudomyces culisetae]OMH86170.1 Radical S-adenosyl methionine domain-containing protein 1, mitochondrial [Zancudomyces culisetae]|eukprot:OMH80043.1 Radical S-adenosyl methionine domain-containing protein 1, mitochondrial [Zancudomyces culisetae]
MKEFKQAGINRYSIGIQSFDDKVLEWMGRKHSGKDGIKALQTAQKLFGNVTYDLIFGIPDQDIKAWESQLDIGLNACDSNNLSIYQLTVEYGTPLHAQSKFLNIPGGDQMADMYEMAYNKTKQKGMYRYEVSSYAKGKKYEGIHNKQYWNGGEYIGVGPGAHGKSVMNDYLVSTECIREPKRWMTQVENQDIGHGVAKTINYSCDSDNEKKEMALKMLVFLGLRTIYGIRESTFRDTHDLLYKKKNLDATHSRNNSLKSFLNSKNVQEYVKIGFLEWRNEEGTREGCSEDFSLVPTDKGLQVIDSILLNIMW